MSWDLFESNASVLTEDRLPARLKKVEMDAEYVKKGGAAPIDGQLLRYDEATDSWLPTNPIGNAELASASNVSGAVTSLSSSGGAGTIVSIAGTAISVPNSNGRPVTLEYGMSTLQTAVGQGTVFAMVYETTSGSTLVNYAGHILANSTDVALRSGYIHANHRIGTVSSTRTFELRAYIYAVTGNAPTVNVQNDFRLPSYLRAVAN